MKVTELTLDYVKDYMRVDIEEDDLLIQHMIIAAQSFIQSHLNRKFTDWTNIGEEVPPEFTISALTMIAHWYENRTISAEVAKETLYSFSGILDQHKFHSWGAITV